MTKKIARTTAGLANVMFEELEALQRGDSTPQQARAKAALGNTILATARLELDCARFVAENRRGGSSELPAIPVGRIPRK